MEVNGILMMNIYNIYPHEITKVSKYRGAKKKKKRNVHAFQRAKLYA
jgi:hypothetical protein